MVVSNTIRRLAETIRIPSDLVDEIGLQTKDEFIKSRNPSGKFHDSEVYDWTLDKLNKDYALNRVYEGKDPVSRMDVEIYRKGDDFIMYTEGELLAVIHNGTLLHSSREGRIPKFYLESRDISHIEWSKAQRVKYLSEYTHLVSDLAKVNLRDNPVVLQHLRVKGERFVIRAAKSIEHDKGIRLVITNEKGEVVAQVQPEWGRTTQLVVAREYRSMGFGPILGNLWYQTNPSYESGGFTSGGRKNALRIWENRVRDLLSMGWYSALVRDGRLEKSRAEDILDGLEGRRKSLPLNVDVPKPVLKKQVLVYGQYPTFVLYDQRFFGDQNEDYVYAHGLFRDSPGIGEFLYSIDYNREFAKPAMSVAFQMARDEGLPLYVGKGYTDILELDELPDLKIDGDYAELTSDVLPLRSLSRKEQSLRKRVDPYGEIETSLLEIADAKWR